MMARPEEEGHEEAIAKGGKAKLDERNGAQQEEGTRQKRFYTITSFLFTISMMQPKILY